MERFLLATRWLLLPLYLGLLVTFFAVYAIVGRELVHLFADLTTLADTELVVMILSILDLVLVANLVLMVAVSSYESFISRIAVAPGQDVPEWLGKLDAGGVKVKVSVSIVMISAVQLLRAYLSDTPLDRMAILGGAHLVFVVSALALAFIDRVGREAHG
jgi:uncharacterized protein (TIGR00645 family)